MSSGRDEFLEKDLGKETTKKEAKVKAKPEPEAEPAKHIDYEQEQDKRNWWLNNTGGAAADNLTVRDYFAAKVLGTTQPINGAAWNAQWAYQVADEMMKRRALND